MGWWHDDLGEHEGFARGLAEVAPGKFREFDSDAPDQVVSYVSAACDCGWRSPRLHVLPTQVRGLVELSAADADRVHRLWDEHIGHVLALQREGLTLSQPLLSMARGLTGR
jgi:hypothetical protein